MAFPLFFPLFFPSFFLFLFFEGGGWLALTTQQYNGQEGVEMAMKILMTEFKRTMALAGCVRVSDIASNFVTRALGPTLEARPCKL